MKGLNQAAKTPAVEDLRFNLLKIEHRQQELLTSLDKGVALNRKLNNRLKGLVLQFKDKELTEDEKEQLDFLINAIWQESQEALEKEKK